MLATILVFVGVFLLSVGCLFVDEDTNNSRGVVSLIFVMDSLFMIAGGLDITTSRIEKRTSKQCQFEGCPYEFEVQNRKDTVLIE